MKSLILKDIYNIMHNMKALVLMLFIFLFITIPQGGAAAYVITCCILCAMMVVTTFSFDENAKLEKIRHDHANLKKRPGPQKICDPSLLLSVWHGIRRCPGNRRQRHNRQISYHLRI